MKEILLQELAWTLILFSPLWLYVVFCLLRGILDDAAKLIRRRCR